LAHRSLNTLPRILCTVVIRFVSVVILCGSDKFVRDFMLTAHQLHMTDGQYVYVVAHQVPTENVSTPWVAPDDQDETARLAFNSVLQVRLSDGATQLF